MADEAIVFSLTTAEMATDVADRSGGDDVDVTEQDADVMTSSVDIGLYYLKAAYDSDDGKSKLLRHIELLKGKIIKSDWPAV